MVVDNASPRFAQMWLKGVKVTVLRPGEERPMPIDRMLTEAAFDPDAVKALTTAYEDVLATLGLERRTDPLTQMIARKIIEHAQRGERDPIRLRESVVKELEDTGREGQ